MVGVEECRKEREKVLAAGIRAGILALTGLTLCKRQVGSFDFDRWFC